MRSFIEYEGINEFQYENLSYFKQINVDFTFYLPNNKPAVEQIIKIGVTSEIVQKKIVRTPKGVSIEGQKITGYRLMLAGDLLWRIEYIADNKEQKIHTTNTRMPFCGYVVLSEKVTDCRIVNAVALIEDIHSEKIDIREIYNNITMMLVADL